MKKKGFWCGEERVREMDESELEEGEAFFGKEEEDCIDPDVDLSYIDIKLQDVLGHLQREFEGGVSVENFGAKFGGYGSFLPTYKRSSSILSQHGSPPKDPSRTVIRSPHGLSCEGACNDASIRIIAPITKNSSTLTKDMDLGGSTRKDAVITATPRNHIEDNDLINKGTKVSIQNTLKVCIKLGSDNISVRNNAAIYSGLGLELSPSSSVENSPEGIKGSILEDGVANLSPRAILQMMTGSLISEGCFLSPLQENLLNLRKVGDHFSGNHKRGLLGNGISEAISILGQFNSPLRSTENSEETAMKLLQENIQIGGNKSKLNDDTILEKKIDVEPQEGQDLTFQTSRIPLLLNSGTTESKIMVGQVVSKIQEDSVKDAMKTFDQQTESSRMLLNDNTFHSTLGNRSSFESKRSMESDSIVDLKEKAVSIKAKSGPRINLTREDSVEKNIIYGKNILSCMQKECWENPENDIYLNEVEFDGPKVYRNHMLGTNEFMKLQDSQMMDNLPEIEQKLRANAAYATLVADPSKKTLLSLSSGKKEKKFNARVIVENKSEGFKSPKESLQGYPKQSQREVACGGNGEVVVSRTQHMVSPLKIAKKKSRARSVDDKSAASLDFELPMQTCVDAMICDHSTTDAAVAPGPTVIKDNWACCDLCEKWRLLPNGTNPTDLPRKWTCSMQFWLPVGMNHCIISEDETTNFMNPQCCTSLLENYSIPDHSAPWTSSAIVHANQATCQIGSIIDTNCNQVRRPSDAPLKTQKEKFKVKGKSLKCSSTGAGIRQSKDSKAAPYLANGASATDLTGKQMGEIGDKFSSNSVRDLKGSCSSLNGTMKAHLGVHSGQRIKQVCVKDARTADNSVIPVKKRKGREWDDIQINQETAMRSLQFDKGKMNLSNVFSEQEELHSLRNGKQGTPNQGSHLMSSVKTKGLEECPTGETVSGLLELDELVKASDNKNVAQHGNLRREKVHDLTGCPMRKCVASNAALVAMKDAKELKHAADRMKNLGQEHEGTALYFQAGLKFLQAAFLSEPSSVVNIKYDELNESLKTYTQTAALCEFCAREYEKRKDMVFAALAYKCMEVAYFKVAFFKNYVASKDHHELQATIQTFSQGDSPSSSASDVDNLTQPGALEMVTYSKGVNSLQNTGGHVIASMPSFTRWLDYTNVSIYAFEASRKSQCALSVAFANLEKNDCDSIASVEEALNFNFHNVEELLKRIRAAMELFNH